MGLFWFENSTEKDYTCKLNNMGNILLFVCLLSALNLATSEVVQFTDCSEGKGLGELEKLEITPCPKQPCELKKGTTVAVKATFIPHENVTDAESSVHGKVMGFWVPFPLPNAHACKDSGLLC